jgi:chromosome segregation ATPase
VATAENVIARIERQKDRCHALLEREGKLERFFTPLKLRLHAAHVEVTQCQTRLALMRERGEPTSKIERERDRCAAFLAKQEKLERKTAPLAAKLAEVRRKYEKEHAKLRAMRG